MERDRYMTVHFNDGSKMVFEFPEQGPNAAAKQLKLAEFFKGDHLVVEADGNVLVFPVTGIKYIAFTGVTGAAGAALPKHAILGAHLRA